MQPPVVHIVGARPNFMKAAPVIRAMARLDFHQRLIHTGQHYDAALSDVFFRELGLPEPDLNLGVQSGSHATQTAAVMVALEPALLELRPSLVIVYGDVNSTAAAALVAAKLGMPLAHVEAGLRSFDNTMPEEVNRRIADLLSTLLFVTAPEGLVNLEAVGVPAEQVFFVGNPMIDTLLRYVNDLNPSRLLRKLGIDRPYSVVTVHRPSNVDSPAAARRIAAMLEQLSTRLDVVLPLHPRGRGALLDAGLRATERLHVLDPLGYLDFMSLVRGASLVVTDSGGIQEETTVLRVPCLTIRPNTERPITLTHGTNRLVEPERVAGAAELVLRGEWSAPEDLPPLWDGHAGERIARVVADWLAGPARATPSDPEASSSAVGR